MAKLSVSKVKVGPYVYDVEYIPELKDEVNLDEKIYGNHHHGKLTIRIEGLDNKQVQVATMWHELMHAMFDLAGVQLGQAAEESVCTSLSPIIVQIIKDNPKLLKATLG